MATIQLTGRGPALPGRLARSLRGAGLSGAALAGAGAAGALAWVQYLMGHRLLRPWRSAVSL